ncbi:MAG: Bax inhibitor-1/YccA family protein, partial [Kiloniellales bacterium]|nr:Bax inhibitor-1/YccA family protein [Kiloniellales bacterium]
DAGLRSYMLGVYNHMMVAMLMTGLVAFGVSLNQDIMLTLWTTPLKWVILLAPLGLVFFLSARISAMSASTAQITFWIYSCLVGLSISYIFVAYQLPSITRVFFITAAAFGGLSLYGYTTKRDLSGLGSFLMMGLIGIIIAAIVNIFLASSMLHFVISVVGVLVFAGLTAYDTQQIKEMYSAADNGEVATKKSILGALRLYLDFLNLFLMLLYLFGGSRE